MTVRFVAALSILASLVSPAAAAEEALVCRYCDRDHAADAWRLRKEAQRDGENDSAGSSRKYAPDRVVDVLRIKIDVTPDFDARTVEGLTTITFAPISKPVREIRLNAVGLRVAELTGTHAIADYTSTDHDLTILFAKPLPVGSRASVAIRYTAEPKQGLYFRTEAMGYPAGDDHLWTQGETHEAPHWFPCFDYPNERSATEVICRVPPAMTVLSNGRVAGEAIDPATGLKAVHWVQEKPHVNYLVCLVAGYFERLETRHGDLRLRFFSQPSLAEHAANSFADSAQILAFFEQEIGLPFPWEKYDQVTIRDFTAGGMENTTLTTLTHRTIFSTETESLHSSRGLDAHEAAHQWFGDDVTCKDWSHLWLNEGFATYYTHLYMGHRLGRDEMLYGLYRDATRRVLTKGDDTRPIVYRGYDAPWEQFDFRAYPKGSWVLHMLRSQLGEATYRRAIKRYLEKHTLSSVVTADLVAELEDASGRSLDQFFDQYVFHGGFPELKVRYKWLPKEKLAHVHIEQKQAVSDEVLLFAIPTKLRFHLPRGPVDHPIEITGEQHDFYVPLAEEPEVVRFDPDYTVLAKVDFSKPQAMLERQLRLADDIVGRLMAAEALGDKKNKKAVAALRRSLNSDGHYGVRLAASESLATLHTDEAFDALSDSNKQRDARVRQSVVESIAKFYRPAALEKLLGVVASEPNPGVAAEAVRGLSRFGEDAAIEAIAKGFEAVSFRNEVASAAFEAAEKARNPALGSRLVELLPKRRFDLDARGYGRGLQAIAAIARDAEDQTADAYELITASLNDPAVRVRRAAVAALGELGDPRALPLLADLAGSADGRLGDAAKKATAKIADESPAAPGELRELRRLVRKLQASQQKLEASVDELQGKANGMPAKRVSRGS